MENRRAAHSYGGEPVQQLPADVGRVSRPTAGACWAAWRAAATSTGFPPLGSPPG